MRVRELEVMYKGQARKSTASKMSSPAEAYKFLKPVFARKTREQFVTVFLDNKNNLLGYEITSVGTLSESVIHPREVFKAAIIVNAEAILVAHNHPSNSLEPSDEDIKTTDRLIEAGKLLGIPIVDHLVITDDGYTSIREEHPGRWR